MRVRIYCSQERDVSAFNTEHVVHRAFGLFEGNLTLDCVCTECNSYFGRTIDLAYARDSLEALLRLFHGTKPPGEADELPRRRLSITLGDDDDWNGCHVELAEDGGRIAVGLVPQVRFLRRRGGWVFITEEVLADTTKPLPEDLDPSREIRLVSCSTDMDARLVACLAGRGIPFTYRGVGGRPPSTPDGRAPLDVRMRFDATILRCVAKIAYNYLSAVAGADFARSPAFDIIRNFVRYDVRPPYGLVVPHDRPILLGDGTTRRQTNGHVVAVRWPHHSQDVVAQVSVFNEITYDVLLSRTCDESWRDIASGHHFDLEARTVRPLIRVPMPDRVGECPWW
jgi:hypothetical protein